MMHIAHFNIQPPVQRELGSDYVIANNGSMKEIKDYCYDVSLIHSLQALLNCSDVKEQVIKQYDIPCTEDNMHACNLRYFLRINLEMANWVTIVMATNIEDILCSVKITLLCK